MRVIVTGATSFIGQAAVKELLRRGCQVTAVVRPDSPGMKAISRKPGVEVAALNLAEIRRLPRILGKSLREETGGAGTLSWLHLNRSNPALQRKNIDYALDALETAADMGCGRFLFSGSQAEYGICSGLMREDMECRPVSEYGKNKVEVCVRAGARAKERNLDYLDSWQGSRWSWGPVRRCGIIFMWRMLPGLWRNFCLARPLQACIMWQGRTPAPFGHL